MKIHTDLIAEDKKGPGKGLCLICEYGLQAEVDNSVLRGVVPKRILSMLKMKITKGNEFKGIVVPELRHIKFHLINCSSVKRNDRLMAKKARTALKKQTKSIEEINEMVMGHIAQSLSLSSTLSEEELNELTPLEKMKLATEATKLLQTEKKISLDAQKAGIDKARFLMESAKLASGAIVVDELEAEPTLVLEEK